MSFVHFSLSFLLCLLSVDALIRNIPIIKGNALSRNRPLLKTASIGLISNIPRLELGIKGFFRSRDGDKAAYYDYEIPTFTMDWKIKISSKRKPNIFDGLKYLTHKLFSFFRRIAATVSIIGSSVMSTSMKSTVALGSTISSISIFPSYSKLSSTQKLSTTPLFYLANSGGHPYLQEDVQAGKPDQRIVTYFMSSDDATEYIQEIAQGNPSNVNEFRIYTTTLEKVVNKIEQRKQSRKLGRYHVGTIIRIQPSSRQVQNAEIIDGNGNPAKGSKSLLGVSIPMFCAEGMVLKRSSGEVFVPYYFCYEDLLDDWNKLNESLQKTSVGPKVVVKDFREVMLISQGISKQILNDASGSNQKNADSKASLTRDQIERVLTSSAVMPPRREIEMLRQFYRNGDAGSAKEFQKSRLIR